MKSRPELIALRVGKGVLIPADGLAESRLRARHSAIGDTVFASIRKGRSPGYYRLAHQFAGMLKANIDELAELTEHEVLKGLQLRAGVGCDEIKWPDANGTVQIFTTPRSLSFENMDEVEFRQVFGSMWRYVATTYWPDCSEEEIAHMAELMPGGYT